MLKFRMLLRGLIDRIDPYKWAILALCLLVIVVIILVSLLPLGQGASFQSYARPTASNATVFNAISTDQADVTTLNATTANMTTANVETLKTSILNAPSSNDSIGATTAAITNTLRLGDETFSGAIAFGTVNANELWGTLNPRYSAQFTHNLGSVPTACIVAGASDINSKLASIYDLTTTTGRVVVNTQGQVFWICSK